MNREKCEKALNGLRILEREENFKKCNQVAPQIKCNVIEDLIHEQFDNPPLKFEELKITEPIWENEKLGWIFIKYIIKPSKELCCIDVDGKIWTLKYKSNRFYRKPVEE